jgi:putative tricarboxylic transport membrane protein
MMSEPANFRRPGELVFALLIVVFSVTAFWQAYLISGFSGKATPGVFPMLASGIMIVSGVIIVLSAAQTPKKFDNKSGFFSEVMSFNHVVLILFVFSYIILMPILGFVISSGCFLFCSFQFLWRKNPLVMFALTGIILAVIYVIFREVFQVFLPQGTFLREGFQ